LLKNNKQVRNYKIIIYFFEKYRNNEANRCNIENRSRGDAGNGGSGGLDGSEGAVGVSRGGDESTVLVSTSF